MQRDDSAPHLPMRDPRGHKGTFGTVGVVGGCAIKPGGAGTGGSYMVGGPAMAATAALRAGAGLARLVLPEPVLAAGLAIAPSATGTPLSVDERGDVIPHLAAAVIDALVSEVSCIATGPGLGVSPGAAAVVFRCLGQDDVPVIADADALNNLAGSTDFHRDLRAPAILTPHVGEFRRLALTMGVTADPAAEATREQACAELAQRLGCVVVLKSAATTVSDGQQVWTHDQPNSALATAGTGDVLCGVIAGLVAQHFKRPLGAGGRTMKSEQQGGLSLYNCARAGVLVHAGAGKVWVERHGAKAGLLASELLEEVPGVIERLRS